MRPVEVSLCVIGVVAAAVVPAAARDELTCDLALDSNCVGDAFSLLKVNMRVKQADAVPATNQVLTRAGEPPAHPKGDSVAANEPDIPSHPRHRLGQVHKSTSATSGEIALVTQAPASSHGDGIEKQSSGMVSQQVKGVAAIFGEGARRTQASATPRGESLGNPSPGKLPQRSERVSVTFGEGAQGGQDFASSLGEGIGNKPSAKVLQESKSAAATFGEVVQGPQVFPSQRADGLGNPPWVDVPHTSKQVEVSERTVEFLISAGPKLIVFMTPLFILVCLLVAAIEKIV